MKDILDSSESSEDESLELAKVLAPIAKTIKPKSNIFIKEIVGNYTDQEFQENFRVSRRTYWWLLNKIKKDLMGKNSPYKNTIDPETQLLASIWILATPDSYRYIFISR